MSLISERIFEHINTGLLIRDEQPSWIRSVHSCVDKEYYLTKIHYKMSSTTLYTLEIAGSRPYHPQKGA